MQGKNTRQECKARMKVKNARQKCRNEWIRYIFQNFLNILTPVLGPLIHNCIFKSIEQSQNP